MLDFNKYKKRLRKLHPTYSDKKLKELFTYKIKYRKIMINNIVKTKKN